METKSDLPILLFKTAIEWREWIAHHAESPGVWLRFYKKGKGESINYAQALDEALCFGWIDSQIAKYDDMSYLQKFTPRRPKGVWSRRNVDNVERLTEEGKMTSAGIREVELAKMDGRWQRAYDSSSTMEVPTDFLNEVNKYPEAKAFFETLNKSNRFSIVWRLQTAKTEATRSRRLQTMVEMMREGKKFH